MTTDVVCVLDASLSQVFELARPIKASVKREAKPMEHPLETGATVTDHRIILPTTIELSLMLVGDTYRATYAQIRDLFLSGQLLTVQTRADSFSSMMIASVPHEESPDQFDALMLALTLHEVTFVDVQYTAFRVRHAKHARTVPRGEQQGADPSAKKQSILASLFK